MRAATMVMALYALALPFTDTAAAQCFIQTPVGPGNNEANAVAIQPDGKIVVAGYSSNGANDDFTVIRYRADLSLDTSFGGTGIVNTPIGPGNDEGRGLAIQPDGKIVVVGTTFSGVDDDFAVVRYNPDGSLDPGFGTGGIFTQSIGAADEASGVVIQTDGKIVVGGRATFADNDFAAIRLTTAGVLDSSFDLDGIVTTAVGTSTDIARGVALQPDGKIVLGGYASTGSDWDLAMVRYDTSGALDASFDSDGIVMTSFSTNDERATAIAIQADGKLLLTGAHDNGTDNDWLVARYDPDGSLDTSFDGDGFVVSAVGAGNDWTNAIAVQPNGRILIAGHSSNGADEDFAVGRLESDGSFHTAFDADGIVTTPLLAAHDLGAGVALEADGRIIVVGSTDTGVNLDNALVRYESDGSLACGQISLHPTGNGAVNTFTLVSGCAANNWDCVNDQPANDGVGPVVANDGLTSFIEDGDAQTNREMFALDDGTVPVGATITEIEVRAQVGNPGAPPPTLSLSYQRIGFDGAPIDSGSYGVGAPCCSNLVIWTVSGISWSPAELDALEIGLVHLSGGQLQVSQLYVTVTYLEPPTPQTYLRSIGTASDYTTGTVAAVNGNKVITGTGTAWLSANRGRGDRIQIDGVDYTIRSVDAQNVITLTTAFVGVDGAGKAHTISRQLTKLEDWKNCISNTAACPFFPVASSDLVADNRIEVGIAYDDSVFTPVAAVRLENMTTDADHTITLTVDPPNRHQGIPGAGVVVDGQDGPNGIEVRTDFVTVEWLEIIRVRGSLNRASIEVAGPTNVAGALLQNLLIHDFFDPLAGNDIPGIQLRGGGTKDVVVRNVMIWDGDRYGIEGGLASDTVDIDNVSIDDVRDTGGVGIDAKASSVTVRNSIVTTSPGGDFVGVFDAASTNNTSSDASAPGANAQLGVLAGGLFVAPGVDLHLKAGPNVAVDSAVDLSGDFNRDIDDALRATQWDRGADERDAVPFRINYRSIGTNVADLKTGVPTISISSGLATLSIGQVGDVGVGDEILYAGATIAYITSRVSATDFTVVNPVGDPAPDIASATVSSIARAYNDLQAWEDDRDGDLVSENRREIGVIYNDSPFNIGLEIDGSLTDAQHFMMLTVVPHHRHLGRAGTGAVVDGLLTSSGKLEIADDFTVMEWLEASDTVAPALAAVIVRDARSVLLSNLIVHGSAEGIRLSGDGGNSFTVRNSIIYNNLDDGISADEITDTITVENCTLFGNSDSGVDHAEDTTFHIINSISLANGDQDFDMTVGTQSYNVSSDGTAFGSGSQTFRTATDNPTPGAGDWVILTSLTSGSEDFHLQPGFENDAIDTATDLSGSFTDDIDGTSRVDPWDVGADELGIPTSGLVLSSASNQSFVVGGAPTPTVSIFVFESAVGGNITAADDIRLRIPAGVHMRWDTSVTTVTLSGGASGSVEATVLGYEDGEKTVVLDVNTDFSPSQDLQIDDLKFRSFTAPSPFDNLELEVGNDDVVAALDDKTITITAGAMATLSSDDDQTFTDSDPPTVASPMTVSESTSPTISVGNDIRIVIPAGLTMTWDAGFANPTFSGPGALKVDPTVTYSGGDTELVITVTAPFVTGDYVVIADVSFKSFVGPATGSLELEIDSVPHDVDDKTMSILTTGSVDVLTATSTTTQNHLEWVNPNDPSYVHTRILARDDGAFPTDALDLGVARLVVDDVGVMGQKASFDDTGLNDGTKYYYTAFVFDGTDYSVGVKTTGRPFNNVSGDVRWAYSTGATAMAPPALRFETATTTFVYAVSNDSNLHAMNGIGSVTPGEWPTNWKPFRLGGIAQQRPPVVPFAVGGATKGAVFVGSQDGTVYAVDADTGAEEWQSAPVGTMLTASPAGIFTNYGAPFDFLVIGTRDSGPTNVFRGLDPFDGSIDWTFTNSIAQGGDNLNPGIISGGASVQYLDPGDGSRHFFFTSRQTPSPDTVWCVKWNGTVVSLVWKSTLPGINRSPNIDGSPIRVNFYGGRIYVGTNGGEIVALDAATGNVEWTYDTNDGPVKGFLFPQFGSTNLLFSTTSKVWSLSDDGATVSLNPNWPASVPGPSTPLVVPFATNVLVGSSNGKLYQLDVSDPAIFETETLGDGTDAVGMPTIDIYNGAIYVGTEDGVIYAVDYPIVP